jgi:V-type H+-transporting ATPase subunit H
MFELNDFYALKLLISYVSTEKYLEQQEDLVAMACFDIGEFARFYPMGRSIVRRLGATDSIMKLMYHESDVVRHYALRCVSKLLVRHNCEL